jgi:hypothetical protein
VRAIEPADGGLHGYPADLDRTHEAVIDSDSESDMPTVKYRSNRCEP